MPLPEVNINRTNGNLGRVVPTADALMGIAISGVAVATKIALGEPKLITGIAAITDLGLVAPANALAIHTITKFYEAAGEGTELYIMLYSDATLLTTLTTTGTGLIKNLADADDRINGIFITKKLPSGYTSDVTGGLEADVLSAVTTLAVTLADYDSKNQPMFGVLAGIGFVKTAAATIYNLALKEKNTVAVCLAADAIDGTPAIGTLAGRLAKYPVQQNCGRVKNGSVLDNGWFVDGTPAKELAANGNTLHDRRYIFFRKINKKGGVYFNDDPTATTLADDYSSISWNRVINKAKILAYDVLVEKLNDDVEPDPTTGGISSGLASSWEGEVEAAIKKQMIPENCTAVKCSIDTAQVNLQTDSVVASLTIVRKGQAKNITVSIGYTLTV